MITKQNLLSLLWKQMDQKRKRQNIRYWFKRQHWQKKKWGKGNHQGSGWEPWKQRLVKCKPDVSWFSLCKQQRTAICLGGLSLHIIHFSMNFLSDSGHKLARLLAQWVLNLLLHLNRHNKWLYDRHVHELKTKKVKICSLFLYEQIHPNDC